MIRKQTRIVPVREQEFISGRWCDLCSRAQKDPKGDWGDTSFDVAEVTVEYRTGSSYPDGGSGTEYRFDVCPDCFMKKLVPWMKSQGAEMTVQGWDR